MSELSVPLLDAHVHLQDDKVLSDVDAAVAAARLQGVRYFLCNGTREEDWPRVTQLSDRLAGVIPCYGLHPWYVASRSSAWCSALERALDATFSGVGEIGLDRWIEPRDEGLQEEVFRVQLDLARRRNRPVTIHCLRAWGWLLDVLRSEAPLPGGMLLHAYGGPVDLIAPLAKLGCYFSFSGDTLDERKTRKRDALRAVPGDRLLVETDAPDLPPPHDFRVQTPKDSAGRDRNHPANLRLILRGLAELRGETEAQLARTVWANARTFLAGLLPAESA